MADADGHPDVEEYDLSSVLAALADTNRRKVVAQLYYEPQGTEQFCSVFGMPWAPSTRTHHFRVLRKAGLIWQRDVGNGRMTKLRRGDMEQAFPGLLDAILAADRTGHPAEPATR
ncbi:ArsR/SmtB family transcription factor [Rhodococcus sp. NPDC058521]|uniref:ArsR/SmtB family transcription factor n=1 Tax=Rhodococcus sp. NPDC058521 TaxID=3346536 RepID=UPI00365AD504